MRIVSYNVRYFGHALRGLAATRASTRGVAEGLASLDPIADVVCLQEVETISLRSSLAFRRTHKEETQLESFMSELEIAFEKQTPPFPYDAYYFRAHATRVGEVPLSTMGLAILINRYRIRVAEHNADQPQSITHHHVRRFKDRKQARICAHMKLCDPLGKPLHLFNTHLSLPTPFARAFWTERDKMGYGVNQLHEARTLGAFVKRHINDQPYVVCGDFNSPPGSPVYRHLTEEVGMTGVQEALGQIDGSARGFPTAGFLRLRMHLDHFFSGGGVHWLDLAGTQPFGDQSSPFAGKSDHVPLIGRFEL